MYKLLRLFVFTDAIRVEYVEAVDFKLIKKWSIWKTIM